jgi:hypothetical protein
MSGYSWLLRAAGHDRHRERALAEASRENDRRDVQRTLAADEDQFKAAMDEVAKAPHVVLGTTRTGVPYRVRLDDLVNLPSWITAGSGGGKSRLTASIFESIVRQLADGENVSAIAIDGKGETVDLLLRGIAAVAAALHGRARERLLSRLRVLRFFDPTALPSWPILAPVPGIPIVTQADTVAETLMDAVPDATVGPRQKSALAAVLALAIEIGTPLPALPWLLSAPAEVAPRAHIPRSGQARFYARAHC